MLSGENATINQKGGCTTPSYANDCLPESNWLDSLKPPDFTNSVECHLSKSAYIDNDLHRRMEHTLKAVEALLNAELAEIKDNIDIESLKKYTLCQIALAGWKERLGKFDSTRAILEDIWKKNPVGRRGVAILLGYGGAWKEDFDLPIRIITDALKIYNTNFQHVTLAGLIHEEEYPDPAEFRQNLSRICANGGGEGKTVDRPL